MTTRPPPRRCLGHRRNGEPCGNYAMYGATVCHAHGGLAPQVRARAEVRAEVMRWGLGDADVDPGEVLLRLVSQSSTRAEHYGRLLEQAYDAAERIRAAHDAEELLVGEYEPRDDEDHEPAALQTARADLIRIFNTGGIAALVGHTYADTKHGDIYATGEAIRGLAALEAQERDRCAGFAAKAIAAGLAERQVRLAERQGTLMADLLRRVLTDPALGLTEEQRGAVPDVARRHLALVAG